jgi:FtsP/CotA-like multicopper oxidase with cupredoxin domain
VVPTTAGTVGSAVGAPSWADVELALTALPAEVNILPGQATKVWRYQAEVLKGDPAAVQGVEGSYLGPILRLRKGQKVRVQFRNQLPEQSIIHWHGVLVPDLMDGHPRTAVNPGQTYTYECEVQNRAGTYWFHPHPHGLTGGQVIQGLAGLFIVSDDEEAALGLPSGAQDLPVIIQDRTFDANNQFVYLAGNGMDGMQGGTGPMQGMGMMGGMNGMMDRMMGFLGERILVNGKPDAVFSLATRAYRLRVLNGSNSRIYKLAWGDETPMTIIGTDGGLLEAPVPKPYVTLGPGERVDLWADFSSRKVGEEITLMSREFLGAEGDTLVGAGMGSGMGMGGMQGMHDMHHGAAPATPAPGATQAPGMVGNALSNGALFPVLTVRIERAEEETLTLPAKLSTIKRYRMEDAHNGQQPRSFGMSLRNMQWLLNGRVFEMEGVADNEVVSLGTLEAWEFVNELNPNEMMDRMGMAHPMHIHGVQFQVAQRDLLVPELKAGVESVREGYVDEGWKDTVLVMPGERVRMLMRFAHPGLFVYHCHNLEHEDAGMMRNYRVEGAV